MKNLLELVIRHPLWSHYLTLTIVILGLIALFSMNREARPPVNFDRVAVSMVYRGASAEDVEQLIIKPIEEKLEEVEGIDEIRATAFEGLGELSIEIDPDYAEKEEVVDEIQRVIDQINDFPDSAEDPVVTEIKATNIPVTAIALYGNVTDLVLRENADWLKDQLQLIEGVSRVDTEGLKELQLKVQTSPDQLQRSRISISQIMQVIREWNIDSPGGSIDDGKRETSIRIRGQFREADKLAELPIRANDAGRILRIKDVATTSMGLKDNDVLQFYNGKPAIILTVVKNQSIDTIKIVERIHTHLKELAKQLPDEINVDAYWDDSRNIRTKLRIVQVNAYLGLALVLIALMLTLSFRMAIVTALGLPIAFLGGIAIIWFYGFTINTLVVLGMIVVLGMLVDDAIVVSENIHYHLETGKDPKKAAVLGSYEVFSAVTAAILTTMLAFLPLIFMREIIGKFIRVMPVVVIFMLLFSFIEALFILPNHAVEFFRSKKDKIRGSKFFDFLRVKYENYVRWSLDHKWTIVGIVTVYLFIALFVGATFLDFVLFPSRGVSGLNIRVEAPANTSKHLTKEIVLDMNDRLMPMLNDDVISIKASVGQARTGGAFGIRERGPHLARVDIRFTEDPSFIKREKTVIANIRSITEEIEEAYNVDANLTVDRVGPPIGRPVQVEIRGRHFADTEEVSRRIVEFLQTLKGVKDIQSDLQALTDEFRVNINEARAAELGLSLKTIANTIFTAFDGIPASETRRGNDEMEITVTFPESLRNDISKLLIIPIVNQSGQYVPLSAVGKVEKTKGRNSIQRLNAQRTITVFGDVDEVNITSQEANQKLAEAIKPISKTFRDVSIRLGGEEEDRKNAVKDTVRLFALSIVGIFIVISLAFESVLFPFFVVLTIPFGLAGVVWALLIHGQPITMMGLIGIVGLSGVVVNGSIILVQFVLQELRSGKPIREAIINGSGRRLRPIILTNATTLAGLIPAIYGFGGHDPLVQPIALTLAWGLLFATILILITLPAILMIAERLVKTGVHVKTDIGDSKALVD